MRTRTQRYAVKAHKSAVKARKRAYTKLRAENIGDLSPGRVLFAQIVFQEAVKLESSLWEARYGNHPSVGGR